MRATNKLVFTLSTQLVFSYRLTPLLVEFDKLQMLLGDFSPVLSLIDKDIKGKGFLDEK